MNTQSDRASDRPYADNVSNVDSQKEETVNHKNPNYIQESGKPQKIDNFQKAVTQNYNSHKSIDKDAKLKPKSTFSQKNVPKGKQQKYNISS